MVLLNSSTCNLNWRPKNINFISLQGENNSLFDIKGINGLVVMFLCNHCPYVRSIEDKISSENKRINKLNVSSLAFMSNDQSCYIEDSDEELKNQINRANFDFPYVVDSHQIIAKQFKAVCTPEFYYFNKSMKLKYRGRLDSHGKDTTMGEPELYYAIEEIISKGYCSNRQHPSMGCSIKWKN